MIVTAKDSSGLTTDRAVFYDSLGAATGDTIDISTSADSVLTDTLDFSSLYDSLMTIKVAVRDTFNLEHEYSGSIQMHSLAQRAAAVNVVDTTDTTITFLLGSDSNPSTVWYQAKDSTLNVFISTSGDTSSADTSWYAQGLWDTVTVSVGVNTLHKIYVRTRNSDSTVTAFYNKDSTWSWSAAPDIDSLAVQSKDSIFIRIDPGNNPSYTYFALQDSITGLFIDVGAHTLRSPGVTVDSAWAWGTFLEWGGAGGYFVIAEPGRSYVFRAYAKDGNLRE